MTRAIAGGIQPETITIAIITNSFSFIRSRNDDKSIKIHRNPYSLGGEKIAKKKQIPAGKAIVAYIAANEGTDGRAQEIAAAAWESVVYRDRPARDKIKDALYEGGLYLIENPVDAGANAAAYGWVAELVRKALRAMGLKKIDFVSFEVVI